MEWSRYWIAQAAMAVMGFGMVHAPAAHAQVLRVLDLNMNDEVTLEDKDYGFRDARFQALVHWIVENDPDIVFLEEAGNFHGYSSVVKALAERVGYDYYYRIGMGFPLVMYDGNGILAKKKFHLSQRRFAKLPHGAPWLGDGQSWIVVFGAISWAVGAELTLDDGSPLYVYTSHLIGNTQTDRDDQMWGIDQDIRAHIARNGEDYEQARVILAGDFNSDPGVPGVRKLLANGYHDTFADAHPGTSACSNCTDATTAEFNPMTVAAGEFPDQSVDTGNDRIDYIFTHGPGMQTLASTLMFTSPINGVWMSDHYGVLSTLNVGGSPVDASAYPNPERDTAGPGGLSTSIHVTDAYLACQGLTEGGGALAADLRDVCGEQPLGQVSWALGVTFFNDTKSKITVRVRPRTAGAGRVWAKQQTDLDSGHVAAFFFDPGFDYEFGVRGEGRYAFGSLQTAIP